MAREFDELQPRGRSGYQVASSGQRYKDLPFNDRWGPFDPNLARDDIMKLFIREHQNYKMQEPGVISPGYKERFRDETKVISQNIPPSPSASNMKQFPLAAPVAPETTGVRPPPPRGLGLPEGGQGLEGLAAGTLPPPPFLQLIEELHKQRGIAQGIPGRALGGPVIPDREYKVGERGPETFVPLKVAAAGELPIPEGFSLTPPDKTPQRPPGAELAVPEGFSLEPPRPNLPAPGAGSMPNEGAAPPPAPAPMAGMSQWSADPAEQAREVAALRLAQGAQPQGGRPEGATTRAIESVVPAVADEYGRLNQIAKTAFEEGDIPPKQATEMAMLLNPASAAFRTGRGIAQVARPAVETAAERLGVNIPKAALAGEATQAMARGASAVPIGGTPLRKAAQQADAELAAAGEAAAARPTGEAVDQAVAGGRVRAGLLAGGDAVPSRLRALTTKSNEDAIGGIIRMAGSRAGADVASLSQLRKYVPAESQGEVQSAIIARLGRGSTGEFDANTFLRGYGNLSDRGKTALFGRESADLRTHLDAIEAVSRRAESWQQFNQKRSTLGTKVGTAAVLAGAILKPLATVVALVPARIVSSWLSRSATAAPLAQYSRAYERVVRTNGAPQAMAAFGLAVKNMNSNLGTDLSPDELLQAGGGE